MRLTHGEGKFLRSVGRASGHVGVGLDRLH